MDEVKSESSNEHKHKKNAINMKKLRENPWIISTIVVCLLVIVILVFGGSTTGKVVNEKKVSSNLINFLNEQTGGGVTYVSSESDGVLYKVTVLYNGQNIPVYVTKDGKYFVSGVSELIQEETEPVSTTTTNVPKSDKPSVELFVMSYCPYGTQAEKGILPVVDLLGDKIDFKIRYVYYLMHGEEEAEENLREYCIQENAPDKFLDYMFCFLEGDGVESNGYITKGNNPNACMTEAGISISSIETCMNNADKKYSITKNLEDTSSWLGGRYPLFNVDKELNEKYGVGGSPTLVINGVQVSSGRSPVAYLDVICQAFNNVPGECSVQLSSSTPSAYFGWGETGASTTAQCG